MAWKVLACMFTLCATDAMAQELTKGNDGLRAPDTMRGSRSGVHVMGRHDYKAPGQNKVWGLGLNYGGYGGFDGMGGSNPNVVNREYFPSRPFYVPAELKNLPAGTVHYWVDGFYEINRDGYMYREQ